MSSLLVKKVRILTKKASQIRVSQIRVSQIRARQIRVSQIRASQIRASQIRASEISSNHRELHGGIFVRSILVERWKALEKNNPQLLGRHKKTFSARNCCSTSTTDSNVLETPENTKSETGLSITVSSWDIQVGRRSVPAGVCSQDYYSAG